jgi:hypothetical protein
VGVETLFYLSTVHSLLSVAFSLAFLHLSSLYFICLFFSSTSLLTFFLPLLLPLILSLYPLASSLFLLSLIPYLFFHLSLIPSSSLFSLSLVSFFTSLFSLSFLRSSRSGRVQDRIKNSGKCPGKISKTEERSFSQSKVRIRKILNIYCMYV